MALHEQAFAPALKSGRASSENYCACACGDRRQATGDGHVRAPAYSFRNVVERRRAVEPASIYGAHLLLREIREARYGAGRHLRGVYSPFTFDDAPKISAIFQKREGAYRHDLISRGSVSTIKTGRLMN
jgi:hypothetical protein